MHNSYSKANNEHDNFIKFAVSIFLNLIKIHGLVMKIVLGHES